MPAAQAAYDELAGKTVKQAQTRIVELLTDGRTHRGGDPADHPRGEVLGERDPSAGDRHQPAVVHPLPAQGRDAGPGQGAGLVARLHAGPVRELGERAHRRLEHHPPAVLRRAVPRLVPDRRRRRHRLPVADPGRRGRAAHRPHHRGPRWLRRVAAQPARRVRRRSRRDGHVGHLLAHPADRLRVGGRPRPVRAHVPDGPAAAGPRDHPHLAVQLRRPQPLRARLPAVGQRRHLRVRRTTPTARSCPSRRATPPTSRWRRSPSTAPTPSATGRRTAGPGWTSPSTTAR